MMGISGGHNGKCSATRRGAREGGACLAMFSVPGEWHLGEKWLSFGHGQRGGIGPPGF